jgi:tripartite-type tricarboxylate transporter receptor subunit TctC
VTHDPGARKRVGATLLALGLLSVVAAPTSAQDWPARPVRIVSTFAPGGTADVLARLVAEHLSSAFKQQFFVEARLGAGGTIGVQSVAQSEPDGYNFVLTSVGALVTAPIVNPKTGYDPLRDLTTIAYVAGSPIVFTVNPSLGVKTLPDFVAYAKKSSKPSTYSSSGVGSHGQLGAELFAQKAGIKVEHIPYKGASQGLMDLVAGHIVFSSQTLSSSSGLIRGGKLIALAHTADRRLPDYPDIQTLKELGYPDLVTTTWFALVGPARLPRHIVDTVNHEVATGMSKPDVQQRLRQEGLLTEALSPEQLKALIAAETIRWRPVIERVGLAAQ